MSAAQKRAERRWQRARSNHATVLEGLAAARRAHPSGTALRARGDNLRSVVLVPRGDSPDAAA